MMLYAGFRMLEISGPMDVFEEANRLCGATRYEQHLIGALRDPVVCSNGTAVCTTAPLDGRDSFDIVMVPGSPTIGSERGHEGLVSWLADSGSRTPRLASISSGAFLVARAGLADCRWLAAHPGDAQRLAREHPLVHVVTRRGCLKDGNLYSAGGVSAAIDLAMSLVQEDLGEAIATRIGQTLLVRCPFHFER
jgi:transcriptional regulator GlxA family with amidase domain